MVAGGSLVIAGAFEVAGVSDLGGRKQREQMHTASLTSFAPKEQRLAAADGSAGFLMMGKT